MSSAAKDVLRRRIRSLRDGMDREGREGADAAISDAVLALSEFASARLVLAYRSIGSEVDTETIARAAWERGMVVALPRCVPGTRQLSWFVVESFDGLEKGSFGIEEPDPRRHERLVLGDETACVVLVPALAFDRHGHRLGYGGGYYDTFLATFGGVAVGLCRSAQLCDSLEALDAVDPHDVAVGIVASEREVVRVRSRRSACR